MRKTILAALIILLLAIPAAAADGVINVRSAFGVKETAERFVSVLHKKGMTLFNRIDHSGAAAKAGIRIRKTELIIFGNPKAGSLLMKCRQSVAIDLPQKALIREDAGGAAWISYNDPEYLAKRHHIYGCDEAISKIKKALAAMTRAASAK